VVHRSDAAIHAAAAIHAVGGREVCPPIANLKAAHFANGKLNARRFRVGRPGAMLSLLCRARSH
jgi:hypothetical protein